MALLGAAVLATLFFLGGFAVGQRGGDTFFSNLYLALTLLAAAALAVLAGVAAFWAMLREQDRSLGAVATVAFAVMVGAFGVVESLAEHDEPGSGPGGPEGPTPTAPPQETATPTMPAATPPQGNSHTNLTATAISPTEVRISFSYGYHSDPQGPITHMTLEALGSDQAPLPGYPVTRIPEAGQLEHGDGQIDLTLTFTPDVLAQVAAFRVCFAGEVRPDLGCATTNVSR